MLRLMLVLMVNTVICACAPVRSATENLPGGTSDAFAVCQVACGKSLTESEALAFVQYDLDAVVRSAPF